MYHFQIFISIYVRKRTCEILHGKYIDSEKIRVLIYHLRNANDKNADAVAEPSRNTVSRHRSMTYEYRRCT